jgi:hypothetical protein
MNKKVNTVLFVLGATVVNILVMLIVLLGGLVLISNVLSERAQETAGQFLLIALFFVAIGASFFLYNRFVKYLSAKIDMDKYFHPIFRPRKSPPPKS